MRSRSRRQGAFARPRDEVFSSRRAFDRRARLGRHPDVAADPFDSLPHRPKLMPQHGPEQRKLLRGAGGLGTPHLTARAESGLLFAPPDARCHPGSDGIYRRLCLGVCLEQSSGSRVAGLEEGHSACSPAHLAPPQPERYVTDLFSPSLTLVSELYTVCRWLLKKKTSDVSPCTRLHTTDRSKANWLCGPDCVPSREHYSGARKTNLLPAPTTQRVMPVPLSICPITNN